MRKNKIIFDARFFGEAGPGRYTKNVLSALEKLDNYNEYYVLLKKKNWDLYTPANLHFTKVLADIPWYSWAEQTKLLLLMLKLKADLLYVPHFNIPVLYPQKIVTAIPDLIMHTFSTQKGTTLPKPYFWFKKVIYKIVFSIAVNRSEKVIVPSQSVRQEFLKLFETDKYVVAYEGLDPSCIEETDSDLGIRGNFILHVGSMYEHKNIYRLIAAFELLRSKYNYSGKLVLIGKKDKFSSDVSNFIAKKGLTEFVLIPGNKRPVSDCEVVGLRRKAELCVFPSLKEGFSLTPLEAQAVGLPCVISDIPVHKEVYGDSVEYFDPLNPEDIAQKIAGTLHNAEKMKELIGKGYELQKLYDWKTTGEITLRVLNNILENLK
ncbi:hypothetical protein A3K34_02945 [candidate division WWE3 bacterium RIFOXYC1_FULL_40_10]|uniref:Glycosyl transferase family 1 domain-containing protein n=1 Tax=candidate division WWE3 bacterium RIFOXYA2_FULL_46_9 TaxID=1802636 RepID=A0A1F4W073_UNCKA|nr:MAG: hypothetical protein A3K58_02945 [candidate division WWE3 bacterium RIFOXYB1_FULL_40_22]OGC61804.1 MAG: hypothetical protein A3K37_02945 [candidate division WWE3 bacterium RIFOXYA1_FULL_40_11]OGC62822.1 MAG: hypothetical protein A2264_04105 [candidate division WWE3 bacterium RIFOXYA2_FULL_46_9]OGC66187.1 MAG: hypothetical protein A3K34_02945 [candidate division WWE3 bacterium RIFOXYC1_FULL_40_10]OGC67582.1 MAG: hypothetical protein A2450_03835 [candidate division WWE3 bacterium RIFOXYC2